MIGSYGAKAIKGDYIGFTFNGVHSSDLGIVRVSDGSRYTNDLLPVLMDKRSQQGQGSASWDGVPYFGSNYTQKNFELNIAYDRVNEADMVAMQRLFGDKTPHYLWFDENPYKQYLVKIAAPPQFKWVCFDETNNGGEARYYKGEGNLRFVSYVPYARARVPFLDSSIDEVHLKYQYGEPLYRRIKVAKPAHIFKSTQETVFKLYYDFEPSLTSPPQGEIDKWIYQNGEWISSEAALAEDIDNDGTISSQNNIILGDGIWLDPKKILRKVPFIEGGLTGDGATYYLDNLANKYLIDENTVKRVDNESAVFPIFLNTTHITSINVEEGVNGPQYFIYLKDKLTLESFYNFEEWKAASHLRYINFDNTRDYDIFYSTDKHSYAFIYNAGDIEAPLYLTWVNNTNHFDGDVIELYSLDDFNNGRLDRDHCLGWLEIGAFDLTGQGIVIDSKLKNLKQLGTNNIITGTIYTEYHTKGDFFKIPATDDTYVIISKNKKSYKIEHPHLYY